MYCMLIRNKAEQIQYIRNSDIRPNTHSAAVKGYCQLHIVSKSGPAHSLLQAQVLNESGSRHDIGSLNAENFDTDLTDMLQHVGFRKGGFCCRREADQPTSCIAECGELGWRDDTK